MKHMEFYVVFSVNQKIFCDPENYFDVIPILSSVIEENGAYCLYY